MFVSSSPKVEKDEDCIDAVVEFGIAFHVILKLLETAHAIYDPLIFFPALYRIELHHQEGDPCLMYYTS